MTEIRDIFQSLISIISGFSNVVTTSKRRRVLTGLFQNSSKILLSTYNFFIDERRKNLTIWFHSFFSLLRRHIQHFDGVVQVVHCHLNRMENATKCFCWMSVLSGTCIYLTSRWGRAGFVKMGELSIFWKSFVQETVQYTKKTNLKPGFPYSKCLLIIGCPKK